MADERRPPHSLREQSADQIRNEQRGGADTPVAPERDGGPDGNASLRRVWSQPGGEAHSFRNATVAAGTKADGHGDLTAAETPDATRRLSDATLSPEDRDATAEAIHRATTALGNDEGGAERTSPPEAEDAASTLGQEGGEESGEEPRPEGKKGPEGGQHRAETTHTPRNPGGIASKLQPGGTIPGGGPGGSVGSIGTGGGSTGGAPTGSVKRKI